MAGVNGNAVWGRLSENYLFIARNFYFAIYSVIIIPIFDCVALKSGMDKDRSLDRNRQPKNR